MKNHTLFPEEAFFAPLQLPVNCVTHFEPIEVEP